MMIIKCGVREISGISGRWLLNDRWFLKLMATLFFEWLILLDLSAKASSFYGFFHVRKNFGKNFLLNFYDLFKVQLRRLFMGAIDFLMVHFVCLEGLFRRIKNFMNSNYCKICILSFAFYDRKCTASSKKKRRTISALFLLF